MQWLKYSIELQRKYWLWRSKKKRVEKDSIQLSDYWAQDKQKNTPWKKSEFLVVDTETSSLDPSTGEMLSIGWVVIRHGKIQLNTAEYYLLKPQHTVGNSATIHELRDCELHQGINTTTMMQHFLSAASGRVLVFHHAPLDIGFLNVISKQLFDMPLLWPNIDTLQIEKKILERKHTPLKPSTLRLANCRARYNLPAYPAHNALSDALATAELLLAQVSYKTKSNKHPLTLSHLLRSGSLNT